MSCKCQGEEQSNELARQSFTARLEYRVRILKIILHGETCTLLSWKTTLEVVGPGDCVVFKSRAARGQNASRWWLPGRFCCQEASVHWAPQSGRPPGPWEQRQPSSEEHLFFLAWHGECAISPHLMLLSSTWLHFVFPDGRCPLPSWSTHPGGGDGHIGHFSFSDTLLHPRYQSAAGAMTL